MIIPFCMLLGVGVSSIGALLVKLAWPRARVVGRYAFFAFVASLLVWSVYPTLTLAGGDGKAYLGARPLPQSFTEIQSWLDAQPPGRVLFVPYLPDYVFTDASHVGVTLQDLPGWGDYLFPLLAGNDTAGLSRFLATYDVKYLVVNPAYETWWKSFIPRDTYVGILDHAQGLSRVATGIQDYAIYLNSVSLPSVRLVQHSAVVVGSKHDFLQALTDVDPSGYLLTPSGGGISWQTLTSSDAVIFGNSYNATDLTLDYLANDYSVRSLSGVVAFDSRFNQTGYWLKGIDVVPLVHSSNVRPGDFLFTAIPADEPSSLKFEASASHAGSYDLWVRVGSPDGGAIAGSSSNLSADGLRWILLGTIPLAQGGGPVTITATGGTVCITSVLLVSHDIFSSTLDTVNSLIGNRTHALGSFTSEAEGGEGVSSTRENPSSYSVGAASGSRGYLVLSQPFDSSWSLDSCGSPSSSFAAYGLVNAFTWTGNCTSRYVRFGPEGLVSGAVWLSLVSFAGLLAISIYFFLLRPRRGRASLTPIEEVQGLASKRSAAPDLSTSEPVTVRELRFREAFQLGAWYDGLDVPSKRLFHPGFLGRGTLTAKGVAARLLMAASCVRPLRRVLSSVGPRYFMLPTVAVTASGPVGFAYLLVEGTKGGQGLMAFLGIGVSDRYRGKGIGTDLVRSLMELAKEWNVKRVFLDVFVDNPKAIALYVKSGFRPVDGTIKEEVWSGETLRMIQMVTYVEPPP
jgi:GNAT superfamily N-acetyltransferase